MRGRAGVPLVEATFDFGFSAAHRMHNPRFSSAENRRLYGKCNHETGHGHSYRVEVTIRGEISPRTGRVDGAEAVEPAVRREILERFDQANLDDLIGPTDGPTSTTEALTALLWRLLDGVLPAGLLWRLRVEETANNAFELERRDFLSAGGLPAGAETRPADERAGAA